jgi:tRNA(Ile)-lysidine synthase
MLDQVTQALTRNCQIDVNFPVLLGVSGGIDSVSLMDIMHRLGLILVAAHFNHGIRQDASIDAEIVKNAALSYGIPFYLGSENVPKFAQINKLSLEEAARISRYQFLFEQADKRDCQAVVVAHNADDQVETILMHLIRGTGLDGLKGMSYRMLPNPWSDSVPLLRPFLGTWRSEIETYCKKHGLETVYDQTNQDTRFLRNRLRKELIPELETYVPDVRKRLWRTANLLGADQVIVEEYLELAWEGVLVQDGPGFISFNLPEFMHQSIGIQRRLVRKAVGRINPGIKDVGYDFVQRVLDFASNPTSTRKADVGSGLGVFLEVDLLHLATWGSEIFIGHFPQIKTQSILHIPDNLEMEGGWVLEAEVPGNQEAAKIEALNNTNPYAAWVDFDDVKDCFLVRPRVTGETFKPLGMKGKGLKVSDFMINQKIPQRLRKLWPLVCLGDEIVWIPGYRTANPYRLKTSTQKIVALRLHQR